MVKMEFKKVNGIFSYSMNITPLFSKKQVKKLYTKPIFCSTIHFVIKK